MGLAALDLNAPSKLVLSQFSDNQMYTNMLMLLNQLEPAEILMSDTAAESSLHNIVTNEVEDFCFV